MAGVGVVMEQAKDYRRKDWAEMDDKERILKLSTELKRTQEYLDKMTKTVDQLLRHEHLNGKLVKSIDTHLNGGEMMESSGSGFRVYDFSTE
jgi:hypothetical protein